MYDTQFLQLYIREEEIINFFTTIIIEILVDNFKK